MRPALTKGLLVVLLIGSLAACGGGDEPAAPERAGVQAPTAHALAAMGEPTGSAEVVGLSKLSEKRIARTVYEYTFAVTLANGGAPLKQVLAHLTKVGPGTTVVDGDVALAELASGARVSPADTITLRHDRALPFDLSALVWQVGGTPVVAALLEGAQLASTPKGQALLGQRYRTSLAVLANDKRNGVSGLQIENTTAGGAVPTIDAQGLLDWTPTEADFATTRSLRLTVQLKLGAPAVLFVPVQVAKTRLVHEVNLQVTGAGTVGDPQGRYLIQVDAETPGAPLQGSLSIHETYNADGSFVYAVRVPVNAGAKLTVLDAPNQLPAAMLAAPGNSAASNRMKRQSAGPGLRRQAEATAADGLMQNIGASLSPSTSLAGDDGNVAVAHTLKADGTSRVSKEVELVTTRSEPFTYKVIDGDQLEIRSARAGAPVFQIDGNCNSAVSCAAIQSTDAVPVKRGPVILIHGFTPRNVFTPGATSVVGGGSGTWGSLAKVLSDRGHPVFELRWDTYMRFEESAGVLARLSRRVAELTGRRVSVVAHSFGGVVAHTAMMGKGIRYQGEGWATVGVDGVFQRLITLGSPLSGIRYVPSESLGLTAGRDDDDVLSITTCGAVTCFQAGSSDMWDGAELGDMLNKLSAIDPALTGMDGTREGETIRRLHQAWRSGNGHKVPFSTVVSLTRRPFDDYVPDLTNQTAYDLGDGLISMMGEAVLPTDFSATPFANREALDILGTLGSGFLQRLDQRHAADMERVTHAQGTPDQREYYFALRASHSSGQAPAEIASYRIAEYPANGRVVAALQSGDHPLKFFIESPLHLAEASTAYGGVASTPQAQVRGRLTRYGAPAGGTALSLQLERRDTQARVSDAVVLRASYVSGGFVLEAGALLADWVHGQALELGDFAVVLRAGDGVSDAKVLARKPLAALVDFGDVDLSLATAGGLIDVYGEVRDAQGRPLEGVRLALMKGENQSELLLNRIDNTTSSRITNTDALGRFDATGLQPGVYSVLLIKPGLPTKLYGQVKISAINRVLQFLMPAPHGVVASQYWSGSAWQPGPAYDSVLKLGYHFGGPWTAMLNVRDVGVSNLILEFDLERGCQNLSLFLRTDESARYPQSRGTATGYVFDGQGFFATAFDGSGYSYQQKATAQGHYYIKFSQASEGEVYWAVLHPTPSDVLSKGKIVGSAGLLQSALVGLSATPGQLVHRNMEVRAEQGCSPVNFQVRHTSGTLF